ncbi:MAG: RHS repeat-associated core domain-containing protein, partial [Ktedonobacterales bacterium]
MQLSASGMGEEGSLRKPYGATRYGTSVFMGDLGFTGQRKDSTPDLVYFNARYYDQDTGVFTSADTVPDGLNRYAYVDGNPETRTDPSGHCPWCLIGFLGGLIVGGAIAYGVQVYNNYQSGAANPWTSNIDLGTIAAGAMAGGVVGGTMGAGASAAGAILAAGGTATEAASAGAASAAMFAGYGVLPAVGGGVAAEG